MTIKLMQKQHRAPPFEAPADCGNCQYRWESARQQAHRTEELRHGLEPQEHLVTTVEATQQNQACVQALGTDSQRRHSHSLEVQVHTSHLQPVQVPPGRLGTGRMLPLP